MEIKKESLRADALANLYRAAYYIAKGATETGVDFFKKARRYLKIKPIGKIKNDKERFYWAEKILDEYQRLRYRL